MHKYSITHVLLAMALILSMSVVAYAQDQSPEELAKESEEFAASTEKDKVTAEMIRAKVEEGCSLLQADGLPALAKFKGKGSAFIFSGTYIWIHDMNGKMIMHPIKFKMEGKELINLKDTQGKLFFAEMNKLAGEKGAGWVDYMWPKPGEKEGSKKISYVKLCKVGDQDLVLGCGVYDLPEEEIAKMKQ